MKVTIRGHTFEGDAEELARFARELGIAPDPTALQSGPKTDGTADIESMDPAKLKVRIKAALRGIPLSKSVEYIRAHPKVDFQTFAKDHFGIQRLPKSTGATAGMYNMIYSRFKRARSRAIEGPVRAKTGRSVSDGTARDENALPTLDEVARFVNAQIDLGIPVGVADVTRQFFGAGFTANRNGENRKKYRTAMDRFDSAKDRIASERQGSWETYGGRRRGLGVKWVLRSTPKAGS